MVYGVAWKVLKKFISRCQKEQLCAIILYVTIHFSKFIQQLVKRAQNPSTFFFFFSFNCKATNVPRFIRSANYFPPRDTPLDRVAKWGKNEAAYNKPYMQLYRLTFRYTTTNPVVVTLLKHYFFFFFEVSMHLRVLCTSGFSFCFPNCVPRLIDSYNA